MGWILPNHLDKSLMVYSASGRPLGALQKKLGLQAGSKASAFYWVDLPGVDDGQGVAGQEDLARIVETHLRFFCTWLLGLGPDDGGTVSALIDDVMASTIQRVPEEDPGVAVLVGCPLALVRAMEFETAVRPPRRSAPGPGGDEVAQVGRLMNTRGFQEVRWPGHGLGDIHARNDGLIGAFQCFPADSPAAVTTGAPFYPTWGRTSVERNGLPLFALQDFTIDCLRPLHVTLLMDPQARVHATTGALPRTFPRLLPEDVSGARRAREVFFQTAPVWGVTARPQMPRPSDDYGEWSWACRWRHPLATRSPGCRGNRPRRLQ